MLIIVIWHSLILLMLSKCYRGALSGSGHLTQADTGCAGHPAPATKTITQRGEEQSSRQSGDEESDLKSLLCQVILMDDSLFMLLFSIVSDLENEGMR